MGRSARSRPSGEPDSAIESGTQGPGKFPELESLSVPLVAIDRAVLVETITGVGAWVVEGATLAVHVEGGRLGDVPEYLHDAVVALDPTEGEVTDLSEDPLRATVRLH